MKAKLKKQKKNKVKAGTVDEKGEIHTPNEWMDDPEVVRQFYLIEMQPTLLDQPTVKCKTEDIFEEYDIRPFSYSKGKYGMNHYGIHKNSTQARNIEIIRKGRLAERETRYVMQEMECMTSLEHPNILKMFDKYRDERKVYLVYEYFANSKELFDAVKVL